MTPLPEPFQRLLPVGHSGSDRPPAHYPGGPELLIALPVAVIGRKPFVYPGFFIGSRFSEQVFY